MRWTDEDMLKFARVASGGSYGNYKGCKSLESKLKKYELMNKTKKVRVLVDVYYSRSTEFEMNATIDAGEEEVIEYVEDHFFENMPDMADITLHEDEVKHQVISIEDE